MVVGGAVGEGVGMDLIDTICLCEILNLKVLIGFDKI